MMFLNLPSKRYSYTKLSTVITLGYSEVDLVLTVLKSKGKGKGDCVLN